MWIGLVQSKIKKKGSGIRHRDAALVPRCHHVHMEASTQCRPAVAQGEGEGRARGYAVLSMSLEGAIASPAWLPPEGSSPTETPERRKLYRTV